MFIFIDFLYCAQYDYYINTITLHLNMLKFEKQINDNVHGYIGLTSDEIKVIDTKIFQRLRNIKQLGTADLVYPGATHTRFAHCLGTMFVLDQFAKNTVREEIDDDELQKLRLAALMHDIGHYPFSHALEHTIVRELEGKNHVEFGMSLIKRFMSDKLERFSINEIIGIMSGKRKDAFGMLMSSALDADKADYMLRDSYNAGVPYGHIDLSSLMRILTFEKNRIVFEKDETPVESFLLGRYHLYRSVIHHKVVVSFGLMLQKIFELLVNENYIEDPKSIVKESEEKISGYTDGLVYMAMHEYIRSGKNPLTRELILMFLERRPLELAYGTAVTANTGEPEEYSSIKRMESNNSAKKAFSEKANVEKEWVFPVVLRTLGLIDEETEIYIRRGKDTIRLIDSNALVMKMIGKRVLFDARIYTKPGSGKKISKEFRKERGYVHVH